MKILAPDFYPDFHCLMGACPDSCCRQGWQIVIDDSHAAQYRQLPGPLGDALRDAMTEVDGEICLRMEGGTCALLQTDGLCPVAAQLGEAGLCHICHTHPRFLEEYGATREIHLSLSCPEAARLSLEREAPILFREESTDETVSTYNTIDPEEYAALLEVRKFALSLTQYRDLPISHRMALLLQLARHIQPLLDRKKYALCRTYLQRFAHSPLSNRMLAATYRDRIKGAGWFPEKELFLQLEHLDEQFPALVRQAVFSARDGESFDASHAVRMEHLLTLWLSHYIPKAVNDGRVDTKIRFAVLLNLTLRRLCICQKKDAPEDIARMAGLLAKEIEHSRENTERIYKALEKDGWHLHLMRQIPLPRKGA